MNPPPTLPRTIAVFPLEGALLLPRGTLPLNIFEPRYLKLVEDVLGQGRYMGLVQPLVGDEEQASGLQKVGCLGRISSFNEVEEKRFLITLSGISRFQIDQRLQNTAPYPQVAVDYAPFAQDLTADVGALDVDRKGLLEVLRRYLEATNMSIDWQALESANNESLVNSLSMISPYGVQEKQALLEATSLAERADILIALTQMVLAQISASGDNDNMIQ